MSDNAMRSIVVVMVFILMSGSVFATAPNLLSNEARLQEQNGELLFPILDPKTGKYTNDLKRAQQIIEQYYSQSQNQKGIYW